MNHRAKIRNADELSLNITAKDIFLLNRDKSAVEWVVDSLENVRLGDLLLWKSDEEKRDDRNGLGVKSLNLY